jgi:hypothetical protein
MLTWEGQQIMGQAAIIEKLNVSQIEAGFDDSPSFMPCATIELAI